MASKPLKTLTKTLVNKITKDPKVILSSLSDEDIAFLIQKSNYAYYSKDNPVFTDDIFDIIKGELEKRNPEHPILKTIGAAAARGNKVELPYFMSSLDKIKADDKAMDKFKKGYKGTYVVSDKLDGNSCLLHVTKSLDTRLYTRGDGSVGQDITHLLPFIKQIPNVGGKADAGLTVRGELIISKKDFGDHLAAKGANARNTVAGVINAKIPDLQTAKYIQFIAYELIHPEMIPDLQMKDMEKRGFKVVNNTKVAEANLTNEYLSKVLVQRREKSEFEIDGIVITHNGSHARTRENPKHAVAFKSVHTLDKAEVVVEKIEWNVSKDGFLIPVVIFTPVRLAGVSIQKASGFNAKYIKDNVLGPGSRIIIIRSGDVIPHILKTLTPSASGVPQMPDTEYEWTATGVDIVLRRKSENLEVKLKNLQYFFDKLDIKGVSNGTIEKLYNAGYSDIKSILALTYNDVLKINGFQAKSAKKLVDAIAERIKDVDCIMVMEASNMLGRGFGKKKIELIINNFPEILKSRYIPSMQELTNIKGIEVKTAGLFIRNLPLYFAFVNDNNISCSLPYSSNDENERMNPKTDASKQLDGMVVVFTGFRDKLLEDVVTKKGGLVAGTVTKKTTLLVVKDKDFKESTKTIKANDLGVPIITIDEFKAKIKYS